MGATERWQTAVDIALRDAVGRHFSRGLTGGGAAAPATAPGGPAIAMPIAEADRSRCQFRQCQRLEPCARPCGAFCDGVPINRASDPILLTEPAFCRFSSTGALARALSDCILQTTLGGHGFRMQGRCQYRRGFCRHGIAGILDSAAIRRRGIARLPVRRAGMRHGWLAQCFGGRRGALGRRAALRRAGAPVAAMVPRPVARPVPART